MALTSICPPPRPRLLAYYTHTHSWLAQERMSVLQSKPCRLVRFFALPTSHNSFTPSIQESKVDPNIYLEDLSEIKDKHDVSIVFEAETQAQVHLFTQYGFRTVGKRTFTAGGFEVYWMEMIWELSRHAANTIPSSPNQETYHSIEHTEYDRTCSTWRTGVYQSQASTTNTFGRRIIWKVVTLFCTHMNWECSRRTD